MEWDLHNPASTNDDVVLALLELGEEIPQDYYEVPEIREDAQFYYQAFLDLWNYREPKHARDHLPWETLNQYAARYGLSNEEFEFFVDVIRELELTMFKFKIEQAGETPKGK